jgi:hypothetical protein
MAKKILMTLLILICPLLYAQDSNSVTKTIGDEEVTFQIPEDYNTLRQYYITLIDMYAEAENQNIELKAQIDRISQATTPVVDSTATVRADLDRVQHDFDEYVRAQNRFAFYYGGVLGYGLDFDNLMLNNRITFGPAIAFGNKKQHWQLALPLTIGFPQFTFGIGLNATFLFSSSK